MNNDADYLRIDPALRLSLDIGKLDRRSEGGLICTEIGGIEISTQVSEQSGVSKVSLQPYAIKMVHCRDKRGCEQPNKRRNAATAA
jgi:hypothetical protein